MTKTYILDTSVIISNPYCLNSFPNEKVIIQASVLKDLDTIKTRHGDSGRNARVFIRLLDELSDKEDIRKGAKTDKNTVVYLDVNNYDTSQFGDSSYSDNKILACALKCENPVVVSKDIEMRIVAKAFGMKVINYESEKSNISELYSGTRIIYNTDIGRKLEKSRIVSCTESYHLEEMMPNECVLFKDENDHGISIGRKIKNDIKLIDSNKPWGLSSKNIEQAFSMDLLLDPKVPLVTLSGFAGTGKSLIAVACGLESVINNKQYSNFAIYRPIQPVGTDMGYLPGELADKLEPWMSAIHDSMDYLTSKSSKHKKNGNGSAGWKSALSQYSDKICMEALTYIRGRSIANSFILMDETQNVTKEEIKTILTRVSYGTKIVLTGDIEQIDNRHLDALNNGLTYVIDKFRKSPLAGHITLIQGERSPLATEAANIL